MKHGRPTYVIAEAGVNHNGSRETAHRLIDAARAAGADAVKFQAFRARALVTGAASKAPYQQQTTGATETQLEMLERLELDASAFASLKARADDAGIEFLATPFDTSSLEMLVGIGVRRIKLSSADITNARLLDAAASTKLPVLLSSGMSNLGEIELALGVLASAYLRATTGERVTPVDALSSPEAQALLEQNVTILHCTTEYPAPIDETNLRVLETLRRAFGVAVGYSDHTQGIAVPIGAVALGAVAIEKHFTLSRAMPGPDHAASLEPDELRAMVDGIRAVERALGHTLKRRTMSERRNLKAARRSIVAAVRIRKGERITADMLELKRPGDGLSPMRIDEVVGRLAHRDYEPDEALEL